MCSYPAKLTFFLTLLAITGYFYSHNIEIIDVIKVNINDFKFSFYIQYNENLNYKICLNNDCHYLSEHTSYKYYNYNVKQVLENIFDVELNVTNDYIINNCKTSVQFNLIDFQFGIPIILLFISFIILLC